MSLDSVHMHVLCYMNVPGAEQNTAKLRIVIIDGEVEAKCKEGKVVRFPDRLDTLSRVQQKRRDLFYPG